MAIDPAVIDSLNTSHIRGSTQAAAVDVGLQQTMANLNTQLAISSDFDRRLMNGFLADQLFNQGLEQSKSAYNTPYTPGAAPLPATPAK